jgi:hypothetical protein
MRGASYQALCMSYLLEEHAQRISQEHEGYLSASDVELRQHTPMYQKSRSSDLPTQTVVGRRATTMTGRYAKVSSRSERRSESKAIQNKTISGARVFLVKMILVTQI